MSITCACGASVPEGSQFCAKCGKAINPSGETNPIRDSSPGMTQNVAGALSYVTFIPAVIFLAIEPYNRNPFVRFHAWQSIFLSVFSIVVKVGLFVLSSMFGFLGFLGSFALGSLISLVLFILWLICIVKAAQNQMFKIPFLGDLAQQQAK
jgi:uncharacterized membrane protein